MTKKELYALSVNLSSKVLKSFFQAETGFKDMEGNPPRKAARKAVYEALAPILLDKEQSK